MTFEIRHTGAGYWGVLRDGVIVANGLRSAWHAFLRALYLQESETD